MGKDIDEFQKAMQDLMKTKLPISRTTVDRLTKLGYAALSHYKHVVVIIEKFIQKCKPAYKVAGLYVIDALVRYNIKHKGRKADVLGPRFIKNFTTTFEHIVKCPSKDFPKIIRVLNLWQAGKVYSCEVIQPLLDIITKVVNDKDLSRSPSVCGPSTPPHDDLENTESSAQGIENLDLDNFPKTPPLPEPEDSMSARLQSLLACNKPPSPEKPLSQLQSHESDLAANEKYGGLIPSTSENIRKLGEFLNGSTDETQNDTSGALTTANSAEFLELLKTVNSEFSKEFLPGSSEKSQDEGDLDDHHLKTDLEQEILGESNYNDTFSKTSPILTFVSPEKTKNHVESANSSKEKHGSKQTKYEGTSSSRKRKPSADFNLSQRLNKLNETLKNEMEVERKRSKPSAEKVSGSRHEGRNYRKRESSPVQNLLSSISSGADLSSDDDTRSRNRNKSGKSSKLKSKKVKKHDSREKSSKTKKKSKKKKKKKDRKSKRSKYNSSSDEDNFKSVVNEMPTRSLKDEMESNLKKSKSRKLENFDLKRALESDPSVNYGPKDYPKKCVIVFSTVLSISNITDLSFKRMNDLLKNFGTVLSVEMVVSVNKALVNYSERKSACAALVSLRAQNEFGISWAFPKPVSKHPWIEMWDGAVGCCVVPWEKAPSDLTIFSEGCFIDQSTVPSAEFTKPNEVTSSTDNCGSEENQKIKKKIAEMIAKSEKTAAASSETSSSSAENKKSTKTSNSKGSNEAEKQSSFKKIETSSAQTSSTVRKSSTGGSSFGFGWGPSPAKKKETQGADNNKDSVKAADSTTDCSVVFDSTTFNSNLKSAKSILSNTTFSGSTATTGSNSIDATAQYQSYMQSQAAMYQMAYAGAYSSYPYMSGVPSTYGSYPPEMAYASYSAYNSYQMYPHQNMYSMYSSATPRGAHTSADQYSMDYSKVDKTTSQANTNYSASTKAYTSQSSAASWVNASYSSTSDVDFRSYLLNISKPSSTTSLVHSAASSSGANYASSVTTAASKTSTFNNNEKPTAVVSETSSFKAEKHAAESVDMSQKDTPLPPPPSSNAVASDKPPLPPKLGETKFATNVHQEGHEIVGSIDQLGLIGSSFGSKASGVLNACRYNDSSFGYVMSSKENLSSSNALASYKNTSNSIVSQQSYVPLEKPVMTASKVGQKQNFVFLDKPVTTALKVAQNGDHELGTRAEYHQVSTGVRGLLPNQTHKMSNMLSLGDKFQHRRIRLQLTEEKEMNPLRTEKSNFQLNSPPRHLLKTPESLSLRQSRPAVDGGSGSIPLRAMIATRSPVLPNPGVMRSEVLCQRVPALHMPQSLSSSSAAEFNPKTIAIANAILRPRAAQSETLSLTRTPVYRTSTGQTLLVRQPVVLRAPAIRPDAQTPKANPSLQQSGRETTQVNVNHRVPIINPNVRIRPDVAIVLEKSGSESGFSSIRSSNGSRQDGSSPLNAGSQSRSPRQPVSRLAMKTLACPSRDGQIQEHQLRTHAETCNSSSAPQKSPLEAQAEHILRREMRAIFNAAIGSNQSARTNNEASERIKMSLAPESETSRQFEGAFNWKSFDTYSEKHAREKVNMESKISDGKSIGNLFQPLSTHNNGKPQHLELNSDSRKKVYNGERMGSGSEISGSAIRLQVFNDFAAEKNKVELCSIANCKEDKSVDDVKHPTGKCNTFSSLKTSDNIFGSKSDDAKETREDETALKRPKTPEIIGIDLNIPSSEKSLSKSETNSSRKHVSRFSDKSSAEGAEQNISNQTS